MFHWQHLSRLASQKLWECLSSIALRYFSGEENRRSYLHLYVHVSFDKYAMWSCCHDVCVRLRCVNGDKQNNSALHSLVPIAPWNDKMSKHNQWCAWHSKVNDLIHFWISVWLLSRISWYSSAKFQDSRLKCLRLITVCPVIERENRLCILYLMLSKWGIAQHVTTSVSCTSITIYDLAGCTVSGLCLRRCWKDGQG